MFSRIEDPDSEALVGSVYWKITYTESYFKKVVFGAVFRQTVGFGLNIKVQKFLRSSFFLMLIGQKKSITVLIIFSFILEGKGKGEFY